MTRVLKAFLLHIIAISLVLTFGCGNDSDVVDPSEKLCRGNSGFAARISGTPEPIEMCVSDEQTLTTYVPGSGNLGPRYVSIAAFLVDSLQIEIEISFFVHSATPVSLEPTSNRALAESNPGTVLFVYREAKLGDYEYEPGTVSGVFTLTLSDESLATATFSDLTIELNDAANGTAVATRVISEGYLLISSGR